MTGPAGNLDRRRALALIAATGSLAVLPEQAAAASTLAQSTPWGRLGRRLGSRLIRVRSPLVECAEAGGTGADALFAACKNPYYLGDEPGLTQSLGWIDAWTSHPSDYAIAAESVADVADGLRFAAAHDVRPIVRGGGHSYFGNSNAAGSLLIWTRRMRDIAFHEAFRARGSADDPEPVPAVSVGAGCLWGHVYQAAAKRGRYVQGGGCLTVGVAGFALGGGYGWFSKQFGSGAANLLEAEVVTADGLIRIVNAEREPDLFFALRGGGGGSFGVVTRLTFRTFPLPSEIGMVSVSIKAADAAAWRALVERAMDFYAGSLFNPHWGEQIRFSPGYRMSVSMLCHGLDRSAIEGVWQPFFAWLAERPDAYTLLEAPNVMTMPGAAIFDPDTLRQAGVVETDSRPGASPADIYWKANVGEAGQVLHAYKSAWLPSALLAPDRRGALAEALAAAGDRWTVALHTNKGLGGGAPDGLARTAETATNPAALDAFALLICGAEGSSAWPGIPGHEPDVTLGRRDAAGAAEAFDHIERLVPDAGCYMSEADYFHTDWKRAYWGANYVKLSAAKRRYDPRNLFTGHHCVELA